LVLLKLCPNPKQPSADRSAESAAGEHRSAEIEPDGTYDVSSQESNKRLTGFVDDFLNAGHGETHRGSNSSYPWTLSLNIKQLSFLVCLFVEVCPIVFCYPFKPFDQNLKKSYESFLCDFGATVSDCACQVLSVRNIIFGKVVFQKTEAEEVIWYLL
jgi:hypothetical protein